MEAVIIYVIGIAVITSVFITAVKLETSWNKKGYRKEKEVINLEKSTPSIIRKTDASPKGESKMKYIYKNKPTQYLYNCIVEGIVGKNSGSISAEEPVIKPNEALPSFEELTEEYPPKLIQRILEKLKRKGYVVERGDKLIVVDTAIARKIKNKEYENYEATILIMIILIIILAVAFLCTLFAPAFC